MSDKNVKRILILLIVMGFVIVGSVTVSTSYALLEDAEKSDSENVITAGYISVQLTEYFDNIGNINLLSDKEGLISDTTYNFNVKNTGTASSKYTLYLNNETPSNYQGKVLEDKYIKVGLEVNGEEKGPFNLKEAKNKLINEEVIEAKELISFKMRLWFDDKYKNEINNNLDAKTFLKLKVSTAQNVDLSEEE